MLFGEGEVCCPGGRVEGDARPSSTPALCLVVEPNLVIFTVFVQ